MDVVTVFVLAGHKLIVQVGLEVAHALAEDHIRVLVGHACSIWAVLVLIVADRALEYNTAPRVRPTWTSHCFTSGTLITGRAGFTQSFFGGQLPFAIIRLLDGYQLMDGC